MKSSVGRDYSETVKVKVSSNSILIPAIIAGKIRYFQLDTGAPTSISPDLVSELNLPVSDSTTSFDYYGNQRKVHATTLPELKIGKLKFSQVKAGIIRPIQSLKPCGQIIDGYLGSDFFSESALQINIRKKEIIIARSIKSMQVKEDFAADLQLKFAQKAPFISVYFPKADAAEEVMFDTGSNNNFYRLRKSVFERMLEKKHITGRNIMDTLEQSNNGSGLFGKQKDTVNYNLVFDNMTLAGVPIRNVPAQTFSSPAFSILGAPVLQLGIVTVDFVNKRFYLDTYGRKPIDLAPPHGLIFVFKNHRLIVQAVVRGSEAGKMKIRPGYVLTKLNAVKLDSLSLCDYYQINWDLEKSRDTVRYTFLTRENKKLDVVLEN